MTGLVHTKKGPLDWVPRRLSTSAFVAAVRSHAWSDCTIFTQDGYQYAVCQKSAGGPFLWRPTERWRHPGRRSSAGGPPHRPWMRRAAPRRRPAAVAAARLLTSYRETTTVVGLLALTVLAEWPLLQGRVVAGPHSLTQFHPWYELVGSTLRAGQLPGLEPALDGRRRRWRATALRVDVPAGDARLHGAAVQRRRRGVSARPCAPRHADNVRPGACLGARRWPAPCWRRSRTARAG